MERRNIVVVAVAVILGFLAVFLANAWFEGREAQQEVLVQDQEVTKILVASQNLEFGAAVTTQTAELIDWPAASVPAGAILQADTNRVVSGTNVAIRPIASGEPILISRISDRAVLSANLPLNMRAVTVPIDAVSGVAGFVFPGDVVDVFLTRMIPGAGAEEQDMMTTVIIENVQVLAVDLRASETATEPEVNSTATLLVNQDDGQKLALARQVGELSLALRNVEDQSIGGTRVVTRLDLGGRGLYMRGGPPALTNQAPSGAGTQAGPAPVSGPSMLVYRGTEATRQKVISK